MMGRAVTKNVCLSKISFAMTIFIIILMFHFFGITINITSSMPLGIYVKKTTPIQNGDIVLFCLNPELRLLGLLRHYLLSGYRCLPTMPLIKLVIAGPGDNILLGQDFMRVNHKYYFLPTPQTDRLNRSLVIFPPGYYPQTKGYWLIGTNPQISWDSRYWGPVNADNILENLQPFWIFK